MSDEKQNTVADRFEAYLLGQLDDRAMNQLEEELRNNPQQADDCIEVMATLAMVREQFRDQREQAGELIKDPTLQGFHDLLGELSAMEDAAEAEQVQWVGQINMRKPLWQQWQFVVPSGIAALLAIAVVLIVVLPGKTTTSSPPIANDSSDPREPGPVGPAQSRVVATLTAERDAVWGSQPGGGLRPGASLTAGQRLTLTQGFAEITTKRGAVAVLEAPCTIELLDHPNAMILQAGKLVGICETGSSKGFLVRTPHMDVTDLGTRFGVDASRADTTEVHVMVGEVEVRSSHAGIGTAATRLAAGESARADGSGPVVRIEHDPDRFASALPTIIDLLRTGQGLAIGDVDPNWMIVEVDGKELDKPLSLHVFDEPETRGFGPKDAQWVGIKTDDQEWVSGKMRYVIKTQVEVPPTVDTGSAVLLLRFHADNRLLSLTVNGHKIDVPPNAVMDQDVYEVRIAAHLMRSRNEMRLEIEDDARGSGLVNYTGLRASWRLSSGEGLPPRP